MFTESSFTATAMFAAGLALLLIGAWAARREFTAAHGLNKIVALTNLCVAAPLAVFGTLHLAGVQFVANLVPRYMPWRMFWAYFVGVALIAAALSMATKIGVRWSGLLFGTMMFLFVAVLYLPGELAHPNRITLTIVFRESSFGAAGLILSANAKNGWSKATRKAMIAAGSILIALAALVFGVQHFLHPLALPGVPLQKEMPAWVPARALIDYATGAALLAAGASILLNWKRRTVTASVGGWLLLLVLAIYTPVMLGALANPALGVKVEGINYFFDTLLFAGVMLAAGSSSVD